MGAMQRPLRGRYAVSMEALPTFPYFENPYSGLQTRFEPTDEACACCGVARGLVYTGNVYGDDDGEPRVCPWCVADGSAAKRFRGVFVTLEGDVPPEVEEAVTCRTPGISSWQDLMWPVCCGDACVFKGQAQHEELTRTWPRAGEALIAAYEAAGGWLGTSSAGEFLELFKSERDPAAYAFECRQCGAWRVEWDAS